MKKLFLLVVTLALTLFSFSAFAYNGAAEDITLSAAAERKMSPDMADLNFTVLGQGATSQEAGAKAAMKAAEVKKALLRHALTSEQLKQVSYRINPVYNEKRKIVGYKANNSLKVRIEDITKLGDVIDTLTAAGVDNIGNIEYSLKNKEKYQDMLLQEAVLIAKGKAKIVAEAGGRTLGRMLTARINSYSVMPRMYNLAAVKRADMVNEVQPTVIEAQDVDLRADVEVVFALD